MATSESVPFVDESSSRDGSASAEGSKGNDTINCARGVSLRLSPEGLVVTDESYTEKSSGFCGFLPKKHVLSRLIPYFHILSADTQPSSSSEATTTLNIRYARQVTTSTFSATTISYSVEKPNTDLLATWLSSLLGRAYGRAKPQKRIKVLINPFGGKGLAQKFYTRDIEPIFAAARCELGVETTKHSGHAVELAEELDVDRWDVVACCSGDGLPHEVFNGLGRRKDARKALGKIAVAQLPCGSGNAMCLNLNETYSPTLAALCVVKGVRRSLDLTSITHGGQRTLSFLSQSVGIVAESDLGTDNLRWMGNLRFTYGFLTRLFGRTVYPCDLAMVVEVEGKDAVRAAHREGFDRPTTAQDEQESATNGSKDARPGAIHRPGREEHGEGLPPLIYGTIDDPLPDGWSLEPQPTIGNFYSGNMAYMAPDTIFFPAALPADGRQDLIRIDGLIPRGAALRMMTALGDNTLFNVEEVDYRKVKAYRIVPREREEGYISIDGERIPFGPYQAEVHRGLGTTLIRGDRADHGGYTAPGPPDAVT